MIEKDVKKPPVQARSRETVKAILEATTRILGREGIGKLSTNRIAEVAGVSVGSLYQFFRNKDSILSELLGTSLETNLANLFRSVERASAPAGGPPEIRPFVTALIDTVFENFERKGDIQRALIEQAPELIGLGRVRDFDARLMPVFLKFLKESGMKIRPSDPETAVFILLQAIRGVMVSTFMMKVPRADATKIRAELIELAVLYLEPNKASG